MSTKLLQITTSNINTTTSSTNSQFKHTIFWNNIIENLKATLVESYNSSTKLKKQHSRFVAVSMGGMLLMKQNFSSIPSHAEQSSSYNRPKLCQATNASTTTTTNLNTIFFTGSQCVDIVYTYLTSNHEALHLEREVTKEKVVKLCQMIMDSGAFEPANRTSARFDDTSLKYYKFKHDYSVKKVDQENTKLAEANKLDEQDEENKENVTKPVESTTKKSEYVEKKNLVTDQLVSNLSGSVTFNKAPLTNKTSNVNFKLKRKLTAMTRSNTVNTVLTLKNDDLSKEDPPESKVEIAPPIAYDAKDVNEEKKKTSSSDTASSNFFSSLTHSISNNEFLTSPIKKMFAKDRVYKVENYHLNTKFTNTNKPNSFKLAQELLMTRQITRELIIEKLLSLIDLPVIEHLLLIDERNDIEYCEALQRFDSLLNSAGLSTPKAGGIRNSTSDSSIKLLQYESNLPALSSIARDKTSKIDKLLSKSSLNIVRRSLSILTQTFDVSKCDLKNEWRTSALECLEFLDWEKLASRQQTNSASKEINPTPVPQIEPSATATATMIKSSLNSSSCASDLNDKNLALMLMKDSDLYSLLYDYYQQRHRNSFFFLDDSFQPLFANILGFIRKSHYNKALEILNLGTLLLLKQTQAELKRLLKFLYLTANSSHSPKLCNEKPNNSILLNHFAPCLIDSKLIGYEETRLLLNFMLNNFDDLFRVNPSIEEAIMKRRMMMHKYGQEEALIEKTFCKRLSTEQYSSKEQTTKALVELINHIIDDPQITLKQKKLKLKALKRIHPDVYEQHFADF